MASDFEARLLAAEAQAVRLASRLASDGAREAALENAAWLSSMRPAGGQPSSATWDVTVVDDTTGVPIAGCLVEVKDASGATVLASGTTAAVTGEVLLAWDVAPSENCLVRLMTVTGSGENPDPYLEYQSIAYLSGTVYTVGSLVELTP